MNDCLLESAANHILAARLMYENISLFYSCAVDKNEVYKTAARLINAELVHIPISSTFGDLKRNSSCLYTPSGIIPEFTESIADMDKIYLFHAPAGIEATTILKIFCESAICRGMDVEAFFCSMDPEHKMEHLIIPSLRLSLITTNKFHRIQTDLFKSRIIDIDMTQMFTMDSIRFATDEIGESLDIMERHLKACISCLASVEKKESKIKTYRRKNENAFTVCR